jgi:predicted DNA-binding transcriptional regulator AlpA
MNPSNPVVVLPGRNDPRQPEQSPTGEALLVSADVAGRMCGRSEASWWRDHAARRIPAPVKLGGRTLWRVAELRRWVDAGCPCRSAWEALEKSRLREASGRTREGGGS